MQSRSASFFNKLAKTSSDVLWLAKMVQRDVQRAKDLLEHKAELDRVYKLIEHSARGGGIRIFLNHEDPLWQNDVVMDELHRQGFEVNKFNYTSQGTIEWWHIPKGKELK